MSTETTPHDRALLRTIGAHAEAWNPSLEAREKVLQTVTDLLSSKNERVRISAARALAKLVEADRASARALARVEADHAAATARGPLTTDRDRDEDLAWARALLAEDDARSAGLGAVECAAAAHRAAAAAATEEGRHE